MDFESRSIPEPNSGCFLWLSNRDKKGYGILRFNGKPWRAHRLAWTLKYGKVPSGLLVCHRCDNPSCVNPLHLFVGSYADNERDKVKKGRHPETARTACRYGHPLSGRRLAHGRRNRYCRTCNADYNRRYRASLAGGKS